MLTIRPVREAALEVVKSGEILLGWPDGAGGYHVVGRFRLADGTEVSPVFQGLQPPTISIGEQGRDTQPFASSIVYDDLEGGVGVQWQDARKGNNRTWWSTLDTRRRDQWTLLRRKVDKGKPPGVVTGENPSGGGVYNNRVWVAWGAKVRQWAEAGGGTVALAATTNASPIAVTTAVTHGFVTGQTVAIAGHLVNTAANGTWTITVTSPTTFTLTGSTGNGVGVATGTVASPNGGWTNGSATGDRTLAGSLAPTNNPVEWEGGWFWPLGSGGFDYWNGAAWVHVATACAGFVAYAGSLWFVDGVGQVSSTNLGASAAAAKIAAGTLAAGDFTARVRVSDRAQGMVLFTTADASADVVPYVIGFKSVYQIDPATYAAQPAGPQLAPHRFPMRCTVLGSDNTMYMAQGLGVTSWSGDLAQPAGLDIDDGVPAAYKGGIVALANGGVPLFALVDATRAEADPSMGIQGADPTMAGVLFETMGVSYLMSREPSGWHVRAVADGPTTAATMLFISEAEATYRVWFSWGGMAYAIDLEQGYLNPLDDPNVEYEATGEIFLPTADFTFKEASKLALMAEARTRLCNLNDNVGVQGYIQYNADGAWIPFREDDGSYGIFTDARHQYLLSSGPLYADPDERDDPPAGHLNDYSALRFEAWRGTDIHRTPVIVFAAQHAIKTTRAITAWSFALDCARSYNGLSAWQQRNLLLELLAANQGGLLHYAFLPAPSGLPGKPDIKAVRIVRFTGLTHDSLGKDFGGRYQLMVSEVVVRDGG